MHEIRDDINVVNKRVVESPELLGKECIGCLRILEYAFFRRDNSYRDGRRDLCQSCESSPRLSTVEHTHRLREANLNSHAVQAQRWENQEEYRNDVARVGRAMQHSAFLLVLRNLVPDLYITEGGVEDDLAAFRTFGTPQPRLDGRTFEYLFYIPTGLLPEYSQYEFDEVRDIPVREKRRGWRTVLLRLIKSGLLSEETCDQVFGHAGGAASSIWYRELWRHRNHSS